MAKGISLHIGLNRVDPKHYGGWDGRLNACEADANDMLALAKKGRFSATTLLTRKATSATVTKAIRDAAANLKSGDIFFLSYSGHGGQVPDKNGDETEDKQDETWVLYDRELVDDELYALFGAFEAGVRILVLSDSCHSGTVVKLMPMYGRVHQALGEQSPPGYRGMPGPVATKTYQLHKKAYDAIQAANPKGERVSVGASILLISGCQDSQLSSDGDDNGLFTATLKRVWNGGKFKGGYAAFAKTIVKNMPLYQTPNLFKAGTRNLIFERQKPFTI